MFSHKCARSVCRLAGQCLHVVLSCFATRISCSHVVMVSRVAARLIIFSISPSVCSGSVRQFFIVVGALVSVVAMLPVLLCVVQLACGQTFPNGVGELLGELRARLDDVDGLRAYNAAALQTLSKAAAEESAAEADHEREAGTLVHAVSAAARRAVAELKYVGGCPRVLDGCPYGWSASASGECTPPATYNGPCVATSLSALTPPQKEEFALKCGVGWPCRDCKTNFAGCPIGWQAVGKLCVAPGSYDGMCSPVMEFGALRGKDLARWAAICNARWPCF